MTDLATVQLAGSGPASSAESGARRSASAATAQRKEAAEARAQKAATDAQVRAAAEQANQALRQRNSELTFEFDDDVGRVVVRLIDTRTREVLRQFPTEEMLQIARALKQDTPAGALLRVDA
jgi:flagellar protein FlaG